MCPAQVNVSWQTCLTFLYFLIIRVCLVSQSKQWYLSEVYWIDVISCKSYWSRRFSLFSLHWPYLEHECRDRNCSDYHLTGRNGREKQNIASDTAEVSNSLTAAYFHASWHRCNKNSCLYKPHLLDFSITSRHIESYWIQMVHLDLVGASHGWEFHLSPNLLKS